MKIVNFRKNSLIESIFLFIKKYKNNLDALSKEPGYKI